MIVLCLDGVDAQRSGPSTSLSRIASARHGAHLGDAGEASSIGKFISASALADQLRVSTLDTWKGKVLTSDPYSVPKYLKPPALQIDRHLSLVMSGELW